jgi:hypothetical protein
VKFEKSGSFIEDPRSKTRFVKLEGFEKLYFGCFHIRCYLVEFIDALQMIDVQGAIQVVKLVLQYLGEESLPFDANLPPAAVEPFSGDLY